MNKDNWIIYENMETVDVILEMAFQGDERPDKNEALKRVYYLTIWGTANDMPAKYFKICARLYDIIRTIDDDGYEKLVDFFRR